MRLHCIFCAEGTNTVVLNFDQPNLEEDQIQQTRNEIKILESEIAQTENLTPSTEFEMKRNLMKLQRLNVKHGSLLRILETSLNSKSTGSNNVRSFSEKFRGDVKWHIQNGIRPLNLTSSTSNPSFIRIEASYHSGSAIHNSELDLVLYVREMVKKQFIFIMDFVISRGAIGWIYGPSGTGKSATTFAFVSSLDRGTWDIIWIHLGQFESPSLVVFEGDKKFSAKCSVDSVLELLEANRSKKTFVVLDGFFPHLEDHRAIVAAAYRWRHVNRSFRNVVVICSQGAREKENMVEDRANNVQVFEVISWTMEEYLDAVKFPDFWISVKDKMDAIGGYNEDPACMTPLDVAEDDVNCYGPHDAGGGMLQAASTCESAILRAEQSVTAKFHYAGGSARFMFDADTTEVKMAIQHAILSLAGADNLVDGPRASKAINRLFGTYLDGWGNTHQIVVSRYAETQIALNLGTEVVRLLFSTIENDCSGSGKGSLFEANFFLMMRADGLWFNCQNLSKVKFERSQFVKFSSTAETIALPAAECWLKPKSERNGGFDAVYVNKEARMVRFIQLARGKSHSLKVRFCKVFLDKLVSCDIETVEICFVVRHEFLHDFKIAGEDKDEPTYVQRGRPRKRIAATKDDDLSNYNVAGKQKKWERGAEEKDVTILSMDDISQTRK